MSWGKGLRWIVALGVVALAAACGGSSGGSGPGDEADEEDRFREGVETWERPDGGRRIEPPGRVPTEVGGWWSAGGAGGVDGVGGAGGHAGGGAVVEAEICDDGMDNDADGYADCVDPSCGGHAACGCDPGEVLCEIERMVRFWVLERFFLDHDRPVLEKPSLERKLLAKAQPDECFDGVDFMIAADGADDLVCPPGERPKVNQAYVWSLTHDGEALWFGTVANTLCLVEQGFLGVNAPQETSEWVCEFGFADGRQGDWRLPEIYRYDLHAKKLVRKDLPPDALALLEFTIGLRAAGNADGVVLLAGPTYPVVGGVNFFAFDADTGAFLGAGNVQAFSDIRTFVLHEGVLYAGVGVDPTLPTDPGGLVLRWTGSKSNPIAFEVVGELATEAANLAVHGGRLYVTTWPSALGSGAARPMGLWRSQKIPPGGLTPADADAWEEIWSILDYDRDPIAAAVTGGGALASFEGKLYWGTMHVPFLATAAAVNVLGLGLDADGDGQVEPLELLLTALGTHRSISIFRAEDLEGPSPKIAIVYGEKFLPRYDPTRRAYTIRYDASHENGMGKRPLLGSSGVGNFFNAYTWSMQVYEKELFVGTFDWSRVARVGLQDLLSLPQNAQLPSTLMLSRLGAIVPREGADLFRFSSKTGPWKAESLTGVGNATNYGVRTMAADAHGLYVGTANPMNLHPDGGWELIRLAPKGKVKDGAIP